MLNMITFDAFSVRHLLRHLVTGVTFFYILAHNIRGKLCTENFNLQWCLCILKKYLRVIVQTFFLFHVCLNPLRTTLFSVPQGPGRRVVNSTPPSILLKIGGQNTLYAHMLPLNFFEKIFSFEGARPKKGLKI